MTKFVQIQWTCASVEEARSILAELIKQKKVACASIIPQVESHFFWDGNTNSQK